MRPRLLLAAVSAACAVAQPVALNGTWVFVGHYEAYNISATPDPDFFTVVCYAGPCTAWQTASITITNASLGACNVSFSSGLVHTGIVDVPYVDSITWSDGSGWIRPDVNVTLDVYIVPHSHNDPGWLSTLEQLYNNSVRQIYISVITALASNPARTFSSEIVAFWDMFWNDTTVNDSMRATARALVANGQLTFVGGGFVQPDETASRFEDIIDQLTLGHVWLSSNIGVNNVNAAWQADPFGHSNGFAYIQTLYAGNALILGRPMSSLDPVNTQSASLWHPMQSFPDTGVDDVHTLMLHDHVCGYWEPMRDNHAALIAGNASSVAQSLYGYITSLADLGPPRLRTVLVMFGDDFEWGNAVPMYDTLDAVLAELNANTSLSPRVNIKYASPYDWIAAQHAEQAAAPTALAFQSRPGWDTIPLMGAEFSAVWAGVFYSNLGWKQVFHTGSGVLRAAQAMHAVAHSAAWLEEFNTIMPLWKAVSLVQHHDAITGDSHIDVMADFGARVINGSTTAGAVLANDQAALGGAAGGIMCFNASLSPCWELIGGLTSNANKSASLTLHNYVAWDRLEFVDILLPFSDVCVALPGGSAVPSQFAPSLEVPGWYSFVFSASIPATGFATYTLTAGCTSDMPSQSMRAWGVGEGDAAGFVNISNGEVTAVFDTASWKLTSLAYKATTAAVSSDIMYYSSKSSDENLWIMVTDGANFTAAVSYLTPGQASAIQTMGALFQEVAVTYGPTGPYQKWRVYSGEAVVHVMTGTGPLDFSSNNRSQDVIVRLTTDLANAATVYTDSNGLEFVQRQLNTRPWYQGSVPYMYPNSPVSSNMYPITSGAIMTDTSTNTTLALLTSRASHAVSSQADGCLEYTVNRVVVSGGTSLAVNELTFVHNMLALDASMPAVTTTARPISTLLASPLITVASNASVPAAAATFTAIATPLPPSVRLLSLQLLPPGMNISTEALHEHARASAAPITGVLLLRLHRIYALGEDAAGDAPVNVDLAALFVPSVFNVVAVTEMTVDGSRDLASARAARLSWSQSAPPGAATMPAAPRAPPAVARTPLNGTVVSLVPMDIRTFVLTVA